MGHCNFTIIMGCYRLDRNALSSDYFYMMYKVLNIIGNLYQS